MKKLIVKVVHRFNIHFFASKSYGKLDWWGIEDIIDGKIYFNDGTTYGGGNK